MPPFRADHVGSLLRPPELLRARAEYAAGGLSAERLRELEDGAIRQIVRMQEDAGLRLATDGEYRRSEWAQDFIDRLGGITNAGTAPVAAVNADGETVEYTSHGKRITGKVHLPETIFAKDFGFLSEQVGRAVPKISLPSPNMVQFRADLSAGPYDDPAEFRTDLAAAYAEQLRGLAGIGARYVQLDDTLFAFLNDPAWRERARGGGVDPDRQHEINVGMLNQAVAGRPEELTVAVHMCRGNFRSAWFSEGGYDFVAEAVFGGLNVDALFLEYDDERAGDFSPLRFVADHLTVVLGLVTTKTPELESKDALKRRVEEASRYVPLDRLCLSPQCGFASTVEGNELTLDQQRAKLELVVETAQEIWG